MKATLYEFSLMTPTSITQKCESNCCNILLANIKINPSYNHYTRSLLLSNSGFPN